MSFVFARPFPVLPGLIVDLSRRKDGEGPQASVSVRDSGTYLNLYHPGTGITFCQRISKSRDTALPNAPKLDPEQVMGTRRTLILVGAVMCIPVFTAVIGVPLILLGMSWPDIVRASGALAGT